MNDMEIFRKAAEVERAALINAEVVTGDARVFYLDIARTASKHLTDAALRMSADDLMDALAEVARVSARAA